MIVFVVDVPVNPGRQHVDNLKLERKNIKNKSLKNDNVVRDGDDVVRGGTVDQHADKYSWRSWRVK